MAIGAILAGIGTATQVGSALGLFGGGSGEAAPRPQFDPSVVSDIEQLKAEYDNLYAEQEGLLREQSAADLAEAKRQTASDLASRGILESPVSEYSFIRQKELADKALKQSISTLKAQRLSTKSALDKALIDYKMKIAGMQYETDIYNAQIASQAAGQKWGAIGGAVGGLAGYYQQKELLDRLYPQTGSEVTPASPMTMASKNLNLLTGGY